MPVHTRLGTSVPVDITADSNHTAVTQFSGFSVRESDGTPAVAAVNFRHGAVGGQILWVLELAANESAGIELGGAMQTPDGVYVEEVAGTVSGVLLNQKK